MKKIGLLGGMSWESTVDYYRMINEGIKSALGGLHSAEIVLYSIDFDPIAELQQEGDWEGAGRILAEAASKIQAAGADCLLIGCNTMHIVATQIEAAIDIPLLHIADATAEVLVKGGIRTAGLIGTSYTMEQDFLKGRLKDKYGLTVLLPDTGDKQIVHDVIYQELCLGKTISKSKSEFLRIIESLADQGAEAVILGCTEIAMLLDQNDTDVRLLDTTAVHAQMAVAYALD